MDHDAATVSAVKKCYEECDLHSPSWLASHFSNGLKSKPKRFVKRNGGYRLENKLRQQIAASLDDEKPTTKIIAQRDDKPAGIRYAGIAGGSKDCQDAVEMLLQYGTQIQFARILTRKNKHCILLTDEVGDPIAIKSGFASGYGGQGPRTFSYVLQLLDSHGAEIEEYDVDESTMERLDNSALTLADLKSLDKCEPVRPIRWHSYVDEADYERGRDGTLWRDFPPVIPFAAIDNRIMDLAISFWVDPDDRLLKGYRRLEDLVRDRTQRQEHGSKLFSQVFLGGSPKLTWQNVDETEHIGRANLFTGAYMAHRNPRAHRELKTYQDAQLSEFLLLNHLFRLERESQ
ncbi:MAG: TIGR02391 family protein [Xanthobacteraceae bacterium]